MAADTAMRRKTRRAGRRWSGFTLLELMIVTLLIAVVASLAYPIYRGHMDKVRTARAVTDIAAIAAMVQAYAADNRAFPPDLATVRQNGKLDPWGRPYVYYNVEENGRGHARKDHALNPINTDFDLYSLGPNGVTKPQITHRDSKDDVLRARNGAFLGIADDF